MQLLRPGDNHSKTSRGIVACSIGLIVLCWVTAVLYLHHLRETEIEEAFTVNANLARAFEEHTIRTIKQIDQLVLLISAQYGRAGSKLDLHRFAVEAGANPELVVIIAVVNEHGDSVITNSPAPPANIADRDHFKFHSNNDSGKLFVGKAVMGRLGRRWLMPLSRRINKPDGSFGGVVSIGVDPHYFSNFYRDIDLGAEGVVTLGGYDGFTRSRRSGNEFVAGQDIRNTQIVTAVANGATHGNLAFESKIDGIGRLWSYRALQDYPLWVAVAVSEREALALYRQQERTSYLAAGITSLLILSFCAWLLRLDASEQKVRAEVATLNKELFAANETLERRVAERTAEVEVANRLSRLSETRFRTLIEWTPEPIAVHREGKLIYVNPSAIALAGAKSADELVGKSILDLVHPDFHRFAIERARAVIEDGLEVPMIELKVLKLDGTAVDVEAQSKLIDYDAEPAILVTMRDVSKRQQAEVARARLAAIIEHSNEAIYSRALDGTILSWNAGAEKMLGYSAAEAIGRNGDFLIPPTRPSHHKQVAEKLLRSEVVSNETDRLTKDGRIINVVSSHSPIKDAGGNLIGVSTIVYDITERKRAEAELRTFLRTIEQSPASIVITDPVGRIEYVNPRFEQITGYARSEVIGGNPRILQSGKTAVETYKDLWGAISNGGEWRGELCNRRKNGELFWEFATISGVKGGNGQIEHFIAVKEDITERKHVQAERASLELQLRESQKMEAIGTLAGGIAHDFNNIIAAILGNVEIALEDISADPHSAAQSLSEIRRAGRRARDLVQQILSFSRRQRTELRPTTLAPVVEESVRLLRATLPARVIIEVDCAADVPPILADSTQIEQIVINLATNATQAMHGKPGHIGIKVESVVLDATLAEAHPKLRAMYAKSPGLAVRLTVSDDASGMDEATVDKIFEPFFTTKPVNEGTGLGLSVVHGIVQSHEGAIWVDSAPGEGSTFTLYFPVAPEATGSQQPEKGINAISSDPPLERDLHILYVDDDEALVFLVKRLLERRGYRVSDYIDQRKALDALRANPAVFDLVLTDYNMPGMSGLDIAREVMTIRPDLPVAVTSGFIDEKLRAQSESARVRRLIFKADDVDVFCDAVQGLVENIR